MPRKISPTLQVLREIRDEIKGTNARLDAVEDAVSVLGGAVSVLGKRQTEMEVRLATELVAVSGAIDGVRHLLRDRLDDRKRVDDLERRMETIERRVG